MKVVTTDYGNIKEILKYPGHHVAMAVMVGDSGISASTDGRKIVPAGTLVGGLASGEVKPVNGAGTEGVLLSDTDVSHGAVPASMVIHGFIDKNKIPEQPTAEAAAALRMLQFL